MLRGLAKPLVRAAAVLAAAGVAAFAATAPAAPSAGSVAASTTLTPKSILTLLNRERTKRGLVPLRISRSLTAAARQHSYEMAQKGYFAHTSADGSSFAKRITRYYASSSYRSFSAGENILYGPPTLTPAAANSMWMHSPGHRRNILNRAWREVGISAVAATAAPGVYHGRTVAIATTDFGVRGR